MSLNRLMFYAAVLAGWAAFFGWLICEFLFLHSGRLGSGHLEAALTAALVGCAIGGALSLVSGLSNGQIAQMVRRLGPGLLGGVIGGTVGGLFGDVMYAVGLPRALGWLIMGLGIGVVEGVYDRSVNKIRNGLIGGGIGGLVGGLLFDPLTHLIASPTGMASRATAFVILGLCIGAGIGLVQVVLKEAWLTVLDGYRPGRQLILAQPVTVLGRAEHIALPFLGNMSRDLELEHAAIVRQPNGDFVIEDRGSKIGTRVNNQPSQGRTLLRDGDVIKLGANMIRFNERQHRAASVSGQVPVVSETDIEPGRPDTPRPVPLARVRPAEVPSPAARPVVAPPFQPVQPSAKPSAASQQASGARSSPAGDACPGCGRKAPGPPGQRYCMICDRTF